MPELYDLCWREPALREKREQITAPLLQKEKTVALDEPVEAMPADPGIVFSRDKPQSICVCFERAFKVQPLEFAILSAQADWHQGLDVEGPYEQNQREDVGQTITWEKVQVENADQDEEDDAERLDISSLSTVPLTSVLYEQ